MTVDAVCEVNMKRYADALRILEGQQNDFRKGLGSIWQKLAFLLDDLDISNFSIWQIGDIVFIYYESPDATKVSPEQEETFHQIMKPLEKCFQWISSPTEDMRLMYQDFGIPRANKELIRHRVFVTHLHPGMEEEYRNRHAALETARGDEPSPGPDSNFSIWYAGGYIFGYDEIDVSMEIEETPEAHEETIRWETKMLEIMDWLTDDVDWLTGKRHPHIVRIAHHNY